MTSSLCFDSSIVVTYLLQDQKWQAIAQLIDEADVVLPCPALAEAIYVARRRGNEATGQEITDALVGLGIRLEAATTQDLVEAARLQELSANNPAPPRPRDIRLRTLSLGDSLILAITSRLGLPILTQDKTWQWLSRQNLLNTQVHLL